MKVMTRDMNKTLMRISTLALLLMVSMGTWADVTILGESSGTSASGKYKGSASGNTFSLTVTPATGYKITKAKIEVYETIDPTKAGTRADIQTSILELSGPDEVAAGENGVYTYTFNDAEDHDIIISKIEFTQSGAWPDGLYYLKSNSTTSSKTWYLWPSVITNSSSGQRYLTTYPSTTAPTLSTNPAPDDIWCMWVVENVTVGNNNYIRLINPKFNKYVIIRNKAFGDRDVWLDEIPTDDATRSYFQLTNEKGGYYRISPTKVYSGTDANYIKRSINSARGDKEGLGSGDNGTGTTDQRPGLIQLYYGNENDAGPEWTTVTAIMPAPTISVDKDANTFSIIDSNGLPEGYSIRYTTGDGTQDAPTATTGEVYNGAVTITETTTIKAVVVRYGLVLTEVATKTVVPATQCDPPTLTYNHEDKTVTIAPTWPTDATLKYALNDSDTPDQTYTAPVTIPNDCDIVRAIASKTGLDDSPIASITRVATPTFGFDDTAQGFTLSCATEGATIHYTTDGSEPTTSSTEYSGAVAISGETTVKAIAVKDGYIYSTIAENTYTKTAAPTITFDQYTNTFTLASMTDGATIHYTTDGTEPTTGSSTYSEAVSLTVASTIKAIAVKAGMVNSTIETKAIGKSNTPVITFSGDDQITITTDPAGAEVYYTTNSTVPTNTNGTSYSSAFDLSSTEDVVQAIAYEADKVSSDVATLTVVVHMGSDDPYLIQSQNNAWATGDHQGCHYYMIPGDENTGNVNTTSLFRSTMEWYFKYAGNDGTYDYYYIVNKNSSGDQRLRYNTNIYLEEYASANDDSFKFRIWEYNSTGSYNIIPKGLTSGSMYVHKGNNNNNAASITLNNNRTGNSLWKFVRKSTLDTTAPFEVSSGENIYYYKINNSNASTYYIVPPGSQSAYATTSNVEADQMNWYFKEAGTTDNGWLTYYHIINGVTGEYLYYTGGETYATTTPSFQMRREYDDANKERYQFTWARSTTADVYFIVPAMLKDEALNTISSILHRGNNPMATDKNRNVGNLTWKFVESTMTLATPNIYYDAANNKAEIICTTPGITAIYYTTDGSDPASSSTKLEFSDKFTLDEGVNMIKAIAIKGNATSNVASKKVPVQTTTDNGNRPYLIRNNGNAWSEGNPFFYMIPDTNNGNANTSSMPRPTMEWYFQDAGFDGNGNQCYYIRNAVAKSTNNKDLYLHRNSGTISIQEIDEDDNGFKFYLIERTSGYSIVAFGTTSTFLNKNNGNNQSYSINTSNSTTSDASIWNFVLKKDLDTTMPFEVSSSENGTHYYKIRSNRTDGNEFYIISPEAGTTYPTISSTAEDVKKSWFLREAGTDDWLTYYNIVCAETGEYLYCTATQANTYNSGRPFELSSVDNERSQYIIVKSTFEGSYFIVPKVYKDSQLNNICSFTNRDDSYFRTDVNRSSSGNTWIFEPADVFCADPVITQNAETGEITITCATPNSEIYYTDKGNIPSVPTNTETDPTEPTNLYTATFLPKLDATQIKAIAVLISDHTNQSHQTPSYDLPQCELPAVSTFDRENAVVTIAAATTGANIYYTTDGLTTPALADETSHAEAPEITCPDGKTTLQAVAAKRGMKASDLFTIIVVMNPTITLEDGPFNYSGSEITPSINSVTVNDEPIESAKYETAYSDNTEAGVNTAIVTISEAENCGYLIHGQTNFSILKILGDGQNPAAGISYEGEIDESGNYIITVKDGTTPLLENTEYAITAPEEESGYYTYHTGTVTGADKYVESFKYSYVDVPFSKADGKSQEAGTFVITSAEKGDFATPSGMTAYIVTGISGNTLEVEALEYIPNGVPVLLLSDAAADGFFVHPKGSEETANVSANILDWKNEETHFGTAQIHVLYKGEFVLNIGGNLPAGRVYLPKSSVGVGGARLSIARSRATGIESVPEEQDTIDRWYSIDGRRLSGKPAKKGLYIKNGHKVVIK